MSIEVKCIDTNKAKEQLKKCPKEVRDYVKSLEGVYKANQANLNLAISKIKQLGKAHEAKTSNERVGCPKCGCNKMTGDGSKSWCLNENCDFVEAD